MVHKHVAVLTKAWAGIFTSVATAAIIGGGAFALDAHSQAATMKIQIADMQQAQQAQQAAAEEAKIPERMARIEVAVANTDKTVDDIKRATVRMDDKLDRILERRR